MLIISFSFLFHIIFLLYSCRQVYTYNEGPICWFTYTGPESPNVLFSGPIIAYSSLQICRTGCFEEFNTYLNNERKITFAEGLVRFPNGRQCLIDSDCSSLGCYLTSGCSDYCNGNCLKASDNTQCVDCLNSEATMIKTGSNIPYSCSCTAGSTLESGHCVFTSASCSQFCNGKCFSLSDPSQCVDCVAGRNIVKVASSYMFSCSCLANTIFKNNNCLFSQCSKLCIGMCGVENQGIDCEDCITDYNVKKQSSNYQLFSCTCDSTTIEENGRCNYVSPDPCHLLCNTKCFKLNDPSMCVDCGSGINIKKTVGINAYICECLTKTVQVTTNCLYASCSSLCVGKCGHEYLGDLCESCKLEPNIIATTSSYGLVSCNCAPGTSEVDGHCIYISPSCSPVCDGRCYKLNSPTDCYNCLPRARNLVKVANGPLAFNCFCPADSSLEFSHCVFSKNCGKYCNGKCFTQNDNTKCTECNSDVTTIGVFVPPDIFSCSEAPLVVDFELEGTIINRCSGYRYRSIAYPSVEGVTFKWEVQYTQESINAIPNSFSQALANIYTNQSILYLPHFTLPQGISLTVKLEGKNKNGATAIKSKIYPVSRDSRIYCGPCQLTNRTLCESLNGICWDQYLDPKNVVKLSSETCLKVMADICYKIWLTAPDKRSENLQCKDFYLSFNWTLMSSVPKVLRASHFGTDGKTIIITFNMDVSKDGLDNCELIFSENSLQAINPNCRCRWNSSKELIITYVPMSQYASSLSIRGSIMKSAYIYAQVFMEETTISITAPTILYTTTISAPAITAACSPITLSFSAQPSQLTSWKYSWRISYISGSYSLSEKKNAEDYFRKFISLSDSQRIITLPGEYSYPDSSLRVICTAQNNIYPKAYYSREALIKIDKSAPIVVISKKLSLLDILKGGNKNTLPITIYKSSCSDSNSGSRLLDSTEKTIINSDLKIWFEIRSGKQKSNISTRGIEEMAIEKKLLERFYSNSILSVSEGDTFKYYIFYNITVFAQYKSVVSSSMIASDSEIFVLTRKDPLCKISSSGLIINPYGSPSILTLKSSLSEIDYEKGEDILYLWSCESCKQLLNGNNCSCDIFDTQLQRKTRDLTLSSGILQPYCIYSISLVITVQNSKIAESATRSCYQSIKLATHPQARSGIKGSIRKGGNPEVSFFVADFDLQVSNAQNLKNEIASVEWDLLEIKNPLNLTGSYSLMNKYITTIFKKDFNMVIDQSLIESSIKQIPSEYIPIPVTVSRTYPPILGIKRNQLICRNCEYIYAIKIIYKNGLSPVIGAISFKSPSALDTKELKIEPIRGKGFQTFFSFSYNTISQDDDKSDDVGTTVQFYRLDCPEEFKGLLSKNSKLTKISLKMRLSSTFYTTLAPGLIKCNYTVLIKMVVTRNYESIETNKTIIIEPATSNGISKNIIEEQNQVKEKIIETKLNDIYSNNSQMTIFQKLSLMSQVAQSGVSSGNITARAISYLNGFVQDKLADTIDYVDNEEGVGIIESVGESLESFVTLSPEVITSDLANITLNIIDNLINKTISLSDTHGSEAVQSIVGTISGIAQINEKNQFVTKSDFNQKLNSFLNNVVDLKFNESMPGEPAYNISSPNIQISIKSQMVSDLIASSNDSKGIISKTETNQSVIIPPDFIQIIAASNEDSKLINATLKAETSANLVFSNSLIASAYNTFDSIKQNAVISAKSLIIIP